MIFFRKQMLIFWLFFFFFFFCCFFFSKNIDKCSNRLHHCTEFGQQCEVSQQGTVRCICREGFTMLKDTCHYKGINNNKIHSLNKIISQ